MAEPERSARPRRLSTATKRRLRQPLDPEHVAERRGDDGEPVRYLEGWRAIALANAIFGEDRWGAEVVGEVVFRALPASGRRGSTPLLGIYTATVRVTVDGCPAHSDVGTATVSDPSAEEHGVAYKASVTDALKRALRHFGAGLGNELSARAAGGETDSPRGLDDARRRVIDLAARAGSDEARTREWVAEKFGCSLDELDGRRLHDAVVHLSRGLDRRQGQSQAA